MYCRMVQIKQRGKTYPTPTRGKGSRLHYDNKMDKGSIVDTTSYILVVLVHSEGESTEGQENFASRWANMPLPKASEGERQINMSSLAVLMVTPNLFSNPSFMKHIVQVMVEEMIVGTSSVAPKSNRAITIIQWVKGIGK